MKRFKVLLQLEIKQYAKAFPGLLLAGVILALVVAGIAVTGNHMLNAAVTEEIVSNDTETDEAAVESEDAAEDEKSADSKNSKIPVAIAVQDESKAMRFAKNMIDKMDSVNEVLELQYVTEKEGRALLNKEEIAVLIIIREKTVAGIMDGTNTPIEVMFPENSGYEAAIFKEFADAAVNMLSSSQAAIYSVYDFYKAYDKYGKKGKAIDRLNSNFIVATLNREKIYSTTEVTPTGELSVGEYYICGGMVLFALFFAIILVNRMRRNSRDFSARLRLAGTGDVLQIIAGLLAAALSILLVSGILLIGVTYFVEDISVKECLMVCWRFVPISLTVASLSLLICRITNSAMAQVMLLFLLAVLQGFITGCFVPKLLLPEILERVAVYTPAYYMIELMSGLYTESETLTAVAVLLGFTLVFLLFGAVCNRRERVA